MKTSTRWFLADGTLRTAPAILFAVAEKFPDEVRFVENGSEVTLSDLAARVRLFAAVLKDAGIGPGEHVALFGANEVGWVVAALATQALGGAFVGIHAGSSAERVRFILNHSDARLLVASDGELARVGLEELPIPVLPIPRGPASEPVSFPGDRSRLGDRACLIYTSGTTGSPKGVVLTHRNLAANGADWISVCRPAVPDRARELLWLPFSHVFGWGDVCIGTLAGFRSWITAPSEIPTALQTVRPQLLMTVPILLERLLQAGDDVRAATGGALELVLAGGASLSPAVKHRFIEAGISILEGYGLTETSPTLTMTRPDRVVEDVDSVGQPYPSAEIRLAPDGEILARGPSVFHGYYRNEEATRAAFDEEGWFRTGDIGEWTSSGALRITDRKKNIIVLRNGKNVTPQPIEARAGADPWIDRLVLFGTGERRLAGLIVPHLPAIAAELGRPVDHATILDDPAVLERFSEVLNRLNDGLSSYERVRIARLAPRPLTVEEGHLTPSFKIRRRRIAEAFDGWLQPLWDENPDEGMAGVVRAGKPILTTNEGERA